MFGFAFPAFQLLRFPFFFFLFFFSRVFFLLAATVHVRYMNSSRNFWPDFREQYIRALFTDPQISFFMNFFIKNGSHSTIYTFKNYFTTVISAISFQFQQNKSYPNRPFKPSMSYTFHTFDGGLNGLDLSYIEFLMVTQQVPPKCLCLKETDIRL